MVDFPNNPSNGDVHTEEGTTWTYREPPGAWAIGIGSTTERTIVTSGLPNEGWQIWGDVLIQWGVAPTASNGAAVINFLKAFKTPPTVTAMSGADANWNIGVILAIETGLQLRAYGAHTNAPSGADVPIQWIAVGEATDADKMPKTVINYGNAGGGAGGATVTIGDTFPTGQVPGDLHYLTGNTVGLYVYYDDGTSGQWVQTNGGGGSNTPTAFHDPNNGYSWRIDPATNTLECWGELGPADSRGRFKWNFPKTFARRPSLQAQGVRSAGGTSVTTFLDNIDGLDGGGNLTWTESSADIQLVRVTDAAARSEFFTWYAIGEWDGVS